MAAEVAQHVQVGFGGATGGRRRRRRLLARCVEGFCLQLPQRQRSVGPLTHNHYSLANASRCSLKLLQLTSMYSHESTGHAAMPRCHKLLDSSAYLTRRASSAGEATPRDSASMCRSPAVMAGVRRTPPGAGTGPAVLYRSAAASWPCRAEHTDREPMLSSSCTHA